MPDDPTPGGGAIEITADTPEVKALIDAAVKEATSGLASNRDEILAEKKALAEKFESMSKTWEGLDPEAVRNIMTRLDTDEETRLLAEGKTDEVINRRTERLKADHDKQIGSFSKQLEEKDGMIGTLQGQIKSLLIEGQMQKAAADLGLVSSAFEDAVARARGVFSVNEDGALVAEENGSTIFGKDGKSSITPAEWLESMREKAPHWFPTPSGGGAQGGGRGRAGQHTITRSQARDARAYQAAKAAAERAGQSLQIVDDTA